MTNDENGGLCEANFHFGGAFLGGCKKAQAKLVTWRDGTPDQRLCNTHAEMAMRVPEIRTVSDI